MHDKYNYINSYLKVKLNYLKSVLINSWMKHMVLESKLRT